MIPVARIKASAAGTHGGRCWRKGTGRTQWAIPTTTIATAMPRRARLTAVEAMPHALPRGGEQRADREHDEEDHRKGSLNRRG
jgi:hypothetical protein